MRMGTFTDSLRVRVSMIIGNGISQLVKVLRSQKKKKTPLKYPVNSSLKINGIIFPIILEMNMNWSIESQSALFLKLNQLVK